MDYDKFVEQQMEKVDDQDLYSRTVPIIEMYIASASLFCILAMMADLLHGLRNRKLWFPCNYLTLNAASLTVIAVAIKLPMDLTSLMGGYVDQAAKLGSLSFMCTMMANLLPSLANMDNKELVTNIIALGVLVLTLVGNVCTEINTGVLSYHLSSDGHHLYYKEITPSFSRLAGNGLIATIYVGMLLMLLIIFASSSLAILKSNQMLESKYQAAHEKAIKDQDLQQPGKFTTLKLKKHVSNYWIMAGTGSPQFTTACSATTTASGVVCALSTILHIFIIVSNIRSLSDYKSDYKWSMLVILIIQFIGVIVGTIAPLCRCFAALSFKLSVKWIWKHIKVSKVESYWTLTLYDWKESSTPFLSSSRKCKIVIENSKILILLFCVGLQKIVVVGCKIIAVIPIFFVICVLYLFQCWTRIKAMFKTSGVVLVQSSEQQEVNENINEYVLQLQDDMEFAERTLKRISTSVNHLIQKAERQQPKNLIRLLAKSIGFGGVEKFESHRVPSLISEEYLNCWSLPLVTLTTIAISLPNIQKNLVDLLLSGVSEGLLYVRLVEESLNDTNHHRSIQKAAQSLWVEVEVYDEWLGNKLRKPQVNTTGKNLQWLSDTAKNIVMEVESTNVGDRNDISKFWSISVNSMYRITEAILLFYDANVIKQLSQEELFEKLSSMIADILVACLTNLPQVIVMKCHTDAIEKREASVQAAAQILGETTQIINTLHGRELPTLNLDELVFIDKWHAYLNHPFP